MTLASSVANLIISLVASKCLTFLCIFHNFLFPLIIHSFYIFHLTVSISLLIIFCYLTNPVYYCLLINSQVIILCWIQFHLSRIRINFLNWPALQHGSFSTLMKWIKMLDASSHITLRILVLLLATEIRSHWTLIIS